MRKLFVLFAAALLACGLVVQAPAAAHAQAKKKLKVAFVLLESVNDHGWTEAHAEAISYLQKEMGDQVDVAWTENIVSPTDAERVMRDYAQKGYDIVFGTTFGYMDVMAKLSKEFPKTHWDHCSGYKTTSNMGNYFARMYQAEYLAGYMAGLMGYKNVGTVATQPIPEPIRGINAFTIGLVKGLKEAGVKYDENKVDTVVWLKSWRDAQGETTLAETLAGRGHDLIRQMADTPDTSKAACAAGVPAIGYGMDAARYGADCALVSTAWNWGPYYVRQVKAVQNGTWKPEAYWEGFSADMVKLSPFGKKVPEAVRTKVEAELEKLRKGQDDIFMGPLYDQSGKLIVPAGKKVSDQDLLTKRFFVKGVSGTIPE
ncbi:basic membrane lipoprotein [Desulfovibrio sp. X2]|uniref:BMP family ABC transporter substrate-binding protein n=1 Tax=Desulfovibrio sp. X2 TaxID=941449 RepID=UPI00035877F0|nr:BMP family ABC transporter substrate-binding protein [Desulfovibrio sp. X2]EPR40773.1 basic membrane lipoprotein [Desulfovibrio sp. X2]